MILTTFQAARENYFHNLRMWRQGFAKLNQLKYAEGWNAKRMRTLYIFDHGTRALFGGAVVTWSRWFFLNREDDRAAAFMNRLLDHFDRCHGKESGDPLWGTVDCPKWFQWGLVGLSVLLICGVVILV